MTEELGFSEVVPPCWSKSCCRKLHNGDGDGDGDLRIDEKRKQGRLESYGVLMKQGLTVELRSSLSSRVG